MGGLPVRQRRRRGRLHTLGGLHARTPAPRPGAWIALAGADFTVNGLIQLAIIGTVLLLITGALGAMARPYHGREFVLPGICAPR